MITADEIRDAQRSRGPATILAFGTATPSNCVVQADYPDYYFRITQSENMTDLKEKFKRMCEKSMIKKRYMHLTEEILKENPTCVLTWLPLWTFVRTLWWLRSLSLARKPPSRPLRSGVSPSPILPSSSSVPLPGSTCPEPIISSPSFSASDPLSSDS